VLKHIEEFGIYVEISGFRNAKIKHAQRFLESANKEKPTGVEVQFFDAELIATWQHLYFAALDALTAFANKENISKSLAMETLLYASAERQIVKATERIGIKPFTSDVAVLIVGKEPRQIESALQTISRSISAQHDEEVLELSNSKKEIIRKAFNISQPELETVMKRDNLDNALIDAVIERMALLATER
jgi:tRNA threonylcarbamoyladenosine modification (KEOPS) complex Cgi121 subunit